MLKHCFELGYRRVEWKCHSLNERSRRAALRMRFKFEGIQESHMIVKNCNRVFPSLARLEDDPWEGLPSKMNFHPDRIIQIREVCSTDADASMDENNSSNKIRLDSLKSFFGDRFDDHVKQQKEGALKLRNTFSISCWHMNDDESDSQWKIYGNSPCSLAIVTSFKRLCESITDSLDVYGSKVIYYNPSRDIVPEGNAFWPVIFKRQAFIHERKFRLIHWNHELMNSIIYPAGIPIAVNLEKLIESIVISPKAPQWFTKVVETFIASYGLSIPLTESNLLNSFI